MVARDFTLRVYHDLLQALIDAGYHFITFEAYLKQNLLPARYVIMRHDVDRLPMNALRMASMEEQMTIAASYYFRVVRESFDAQIIKSVASLGHEIGYHYEDLSMARGNYALAYKLYAEHLSLIESFYPVSTICMHGSPLSKWDNRDLWKHFDFRKNQVIGEPYFDIDFDQVLYLSDTGRNWRNSKSIVRDRVTDRSYGYRSTYQLIEGISKGELPDRLMLNVHPERWDDRLTPWASQLISQNFKNIAKYFLNILR